VYLDRKPPAIPYWPYCQPLRELNNLELLSIDEVKNRWFESLKSYQNNSFALSVENKNNLNRILNILQNQNETIAIVNVNDECLVCNISTIDFVANAQLNNVKVILLSDVCETRLASFFSNRTKFFPREKWIAELINIKDNSDICGAVVKNNRIYLMNPMQFNIDIIKQL